jgi:hypothetical protein
LFHALQTKLHEVAGTHQEKISFAPVPIVERALRTSSWLKAKPFTWRWHSCCQPSCRGNDHITGTSHAVAQACADATEQRAQALEGQVSTVVETNA